MSVEQIITLGIGIFGAVFGNGFIQFWLNRKDKQKQESIESKLQPIGEKIDKILNEQKKNLRTQLLVMMNMMPNNQEEIMTCAERYFKQLEGDWFYSSLFNKYLKENNIEPPIWFNMKK